MHDQRGATLAEYALLVGLVALVCLGAITVLGLRSKDTVEEVSAQVDRGETPPGGGNGAGDGDGGIDDGGGGGGIDDGGGAQGGTTTTSTTAATTTTSTPTTTTTQPLTTTTADPSTPTTAPLPAPGEDYPTESGFADPDLVVEGLDWRVETGLVLWADDGTPLRDTDATVEIWRHVLTRYGWRWARSVVPVTTGADGTAPFSTPDYPGWGSGEVDRVVIRIVSVDDPSWDGSSGDLDVTN